MAKVETSVHRFDAENIQRIVKRFAENNGYEKCHTVLLKVQKCINKGEDAVKQMELLVKETNSLHKIMAATKAGGTVATIGGSIGGILFGAATGGFGALLVAGIVVGGGLGVNTASSVFEHTSVEQKRKLVNRYLKKYADAVQELKESWEHLEQLCEEISIEEDTSTMSMLLLLWSNFTQMASVFNCNEAWEVLTNLVTSIPEHAAKLLEKVFGFIGQIIYQIPDSYSILFKGNRHTTAQQVEDVHLPNLRRQINQLKITRKELAKASQK